MSESPTKRERVLSGRVLSDRMDKSITVLVERRIRHPLYGKYIRRSTKILAHDEDNQAKAGDWVEIVECRPLSRRKSWRLERVAVDAAGAGSPAP
ncbi:MAG: 30S ribosomal protein S17 [Salinisphaera sp.]|nr:30S ribosomal protein S17 [Salinisphaera sp.]MDN5938098.1 30S ribosomal protein S17 [Salinisphaera sp.]